MFRLDSTNLANRGSLVLVFPRFHNLARGSSAAAYYGFLRRHFLRVPTYA